MCKTLSTEESKLSSPLQRKISIGDALIDGARILKNSSTPLLDARVLLKFAAGLDDAALIARSDKHLPQEIEIKYFRLIDRRAQGEPVAYLTGEKEFWSLPFIVTPDVLIPRNDSECLIETAIALRDPGGAFNILDLGTGSGCLLCALLSAFPNSVGVGADSSEPALHIARRNAARLGFGHRATFIAGDWLAPVAGAQFDIIISNPPYIAEAEQATLADDVSCYEPQAALFAGPDGMGAFRAILASIKGCLRPNGLLLLECGASQADALSAMVGKTFSTADIMIVNDIEGRNRGVAAQERPVKKGD